MTLSLKNSTTKDLGFVMSLALNGARHGHFDPRVSTEKEAYRAYLNSAITYQTDLSGYSTHVMVAYDNASRIGATVVTKAVGTPDAGVEIALIALKNEHRGKGYGADMLDVLMNHYLPTMSVYARCFPASEKFHQMLLRRGFSEVGQSGKSVILRHGAIGPV